MRFKLIVACFLAAVLPLEAVFAAEPITAAESAQALAPFMENQTLLVLRVDLEQLDATAMTRFMQTVGRMENEGEFLQQTQATLAAVRTAGGRELFMMGSLSDLPHHAPYWIITVAQPGQAESLAKILQPTPTNPHYLGSMTDEMVCQAMHGAVVLGHASTIKRLATRQPVARPELATAFGAAGEGVATLAVIPSSDARRALQQLLPNLPAAFGGGSAQPLANGLEWAVANLTMDESPRIKWTLKSPGNAEATAFVEAWNKAVKSLAGLKGWPNDWPAPDAFQKILRPTIKEDRLELAVGKTAEEASWLNSVIGQFARMELNTRIRTVVTRDLQQIGLALHNFHDAHKSFPPGASRNETGKRLLSWRVHILPFVEQQALYEKFHLDEPWDSEHNRQLLDQMPAIYRDPRVVGPSNKTRLLGLANVDGVFAGEAGTTFKDMTDGTSNTIMVMEAPIEREVPWTSPDDLVLTKDQLPAAFAKAGEEMVATLFGDGSVRNFTVQEITAEFWGYFTISGGEVIP